MIWLTWRQHRKQLLVAVIGLLVVSAVLLPTGKAMHDSYVNTGLKACLAKLGGAQLVSAAAANSCQALSIQFQGRFGGMAAVAVLLVMLPLLVGLFFGAPLVAREIEQGTHRFAWTQGVSRLRWAMVKFGLIGGATLVLAVLYSLGMSWWAQPLSEVGSGRLSNLAFDVQGIAPIGYTIFAVALGIFAGTVCRRTLGAMAVTLAGFFGVRVLIEVYARPRYMSAETLTFALQSSDTPNPATGDWVYTNGVRDAAGQLVQSNSEISCAAGGVAPVDPGGGPVGAVPVPGGPCGNNLGLGPGAYNWELYQPGSRFWEFQGIETGIFVGLAAALVFLAVWRLRRIG